MLRRHFLMAAAAGAVALAIGIPSASAQALPPLKPKEHYTVGFSQPASVSAWRQAQLESMKAEAARLGHQIVYADAAGSADKQVADVNVMIAQGVDLIFLAPRDEKPLIPVILAAKGAGIPVILLDRSVDQSLARAGKDYVTFIGSDFVEQGRRAAEALVKAMPENAGILQVEGFPGSSPAINRRKGFEDALKAHPGMRIVASQPGDFERAKGRQVAETLLQAHPEANPIYAHNDEMALGAIAALEAMGRKPGQDAILVSVDGTRAALQAVVDGKLLATVESNPRFGPKAFETMMRYARGERIEPWVVIPDRLFDKSNAAQLIADAY
jgi:galactofuranose transport system substrate-binding protein